MSITSVVLTPSTFELPPGWSAEALRQAAQRAADRWSFPNVPCSVKVTVTEARPVWLAARDGVDLIVYRARTWCHNERCAPGSTFPLRAMAMTTTYPARGRGGVPAEADIELNGVAFRFGGDRGAGASPAPGRWSVPLESVLVHEIGHALGLTDACGSARRASGQPVTKDCSPAERARVMYASNTGAEPAPADVEALCALYPPEQAAVVGGATKGGRSSAGARMAGGAVLVSLVLGFIVFRRRVRRWRGTRTERLIAGS